MRFFIAGAGAKSSPRCLASAATNTFRNVSPSPPPLHLPFHPSKPPANNLRLLSTLHERKATYVPSAFSKGLECGGGGGETLPSSSSERKLAVVAWSVVTLVVAMANRVLQKLALVPMKDYPFILAQLNIFAYVLVFFSVLLVRYRVGITTNEMLVIPKLPFVAIGSLEFLSSVCGMYAGEPSISCSHATGASHTLTISSGVVVAVSRGGTNSGMLSGISPLWPGLMIASSFFQAAASIFKESVFIDAAKRLKGKSLDIFVINSFSSGFQALFTIAFLPILSSMKGIPLSQLPSYFTSGAACFFNIGTNTIGCEGAPLLPLLYIASNIFFSISILNLLKVSNAIVASLASRAAVPFAIYILSQPLPYLPKGVSLSPFFHMGSAVLVMGLIMYNLPKPKFS
ncbi:hypothetical protein SASPL_132233 [Salvia splendens]|uniref:Uncharacterized protein n=1 Tax=Salvia splendens TaxID=180675 RepID=A0A8X8ZMD7_SALSN|nr:hypothetical protein SASPL_132233 [Salvia splendens]